MFSPSRILNEKNDIVMDHQNVERAFKDLNNKFERAKDVVAGLKSCEDDLKQNVEVLSKRQVPLSLNCVS